MIPNIVKGGRMKGLLTYLAGPGRHNEHTNQRVVAGSEIAVAKLAGRALSESVAREIADVLDRPREVFGTIVERTDRAAVAAAVARGTSGGVAIKEATKAEHVWHCSLSLSPEEGVQSDEKWQAVAEDFMKEMEFDDPDSPRAPARWVAVRHGLSGDPASGTPGNDHIHIAASVVREDGTKVNLSNDYRRTQNACNVLEHRHGLRVLQSRENSLGSRGLKPAELAAAQRSRAPETARETVERRVRACASSSKTEAEFVRRVRGSGVRIRPRFAKGGEDTVIGYSVALRDSTPSKIGPVWFGGGRLAKDLTLPRLREEWDRDETSASDALDEWRAVRREQPSVRQGRESKQIDPALVARAAQDIELWNKYLATIPVTDRAQWARAAGRTAGVFAAWSTRTETTPGPLAQASAQLARSAQLPANQRWPKKAGTVSAGGAALIMMQANSHLDKGAAYTLLLRQLMKATEAIAAAHRAGGDAQRAIELETFARSQLETVHARMVPADSPELGGERAEMSAAVLAASDFAFGANHAVRAGVTQPEIADLRHNPNREPQRQGDDKQL